MKSEKPKHLKVIVVPHRGSTFYNLIISTRALAAALALPAVLAGAGVWAFTAGASSKPPGKPAAAAPVNPETRREVKQLERKADTLQKELRDLRRAGDQLDRNMKSYFHGRTLSPPAAPGNPPRNGRARSAAPSDVLETLETRFDAMSREAALRRTAVNAAHLTLVRTVQAQDRIPHAVPVDKIRITSPFGWRRHPISGLSEYHPGLDLDGETGDPIYAAASGTVQSVEYAGGYGLMISIDHGNGYVTHYAHLHTAVVKKGQSVTPGQRIGGMGSSGYSTGSHLHFEVLYQGTLQNPERFLGATPPGAL